MRVKVSLTIDVDAEAWATDFGVEGRQAIGADVRQYVRNEVREALRDRGLATEVYLQTPAQYAPRMPRS